MAEEFDFKQGEILLIDKPLHWTSFQVVKKVRYLIKKIVKQKVKVGHAGTLDPLASGLLILATGKKTKEIHEYQGQDKVYRGLIRLGQNTPSYDRETEVSEEFSLENISEAEIQKQKEEFTGAIEQFPPMHSAVKVEGKRLYKLARAGKEVELKARKVEIKSFEIEKVDLPFVHFRVECSKGTYIRSLAYDFGKALGCGGHLWELERTQIGEFSLEEAWDLEELVAVLSDLSNPASAEGET